MSRHDLLRAAFDEAAGPVCSVCPACQGPNAATSGVVVLWEGEEVKHCSSCGLPVDGKGASLVGLGQGGKPQLHLVRVARGLSYTPELPKPRRSTRTPLPAAL